ncbi:MAG: iron hydrogenase small subunit, partial [Firmicutes bacterium]|nr:iron hydrogenase small subunit [Bacillota bacterium]
IKSSEQNPVITMMYEGPLKGRTHEMLHVHYEKPKKPAK